MITGIEGMVEMAVSVAAVPAIRYKALGIWHETDWLEYNRKAQECGLGLADLGLRRGETVAILAKNRPEWLYTEMGSLGVGGRVCGIYPTLPWDDMIHIIDETQAVFLFIDNDYSFEDLDVLTKTCRQLRNIIIYDSAILDTKEVNRRLSFAYLCKMGRDFGLRNPEFWANGVTLAQAADVALVAYTPGTTDRPKGFTVTYAEIEAQARRIIAAFDISKKDEHLVVMPLGYALENIICAFAARHSGYVVCFAENDDTLSANARELQPTMLFTVPRYWEKMFAEISARVADAGFVGNLGYQAALSIGRRIAIGMLTKKPAPIANKALFKLAEWLVLNRIKANIGASRARIVAIVSGRLPEDVLMWMLAVGLHPRETYSLAEAFGLVSVMPPVIRVGSSGLPLSALQVAVSDQGEIKVREDRGSTPLYGGVRPDDILAGTWLHTGDKGRLDDAGHLHVDTRLSNLISLDNKYTIDPSPIERHLKLSAYVLEAAVFKGAGCSLCAVIYLDRDNVVRYAQQKGLSFTDFGPLCDSKAVEELVCGVIAVANRKIESPTRISKYCILDPRSAVDEELITPMMTLKRHKLMEKYAAGMRLIS